VVDHGNKGIVFPSTITSLNRILNGEVAGCSPPCYISVSKGINCNYVTGALTQIKNNNVSHNQQGIKNDGSLNITIDSNTFLNNSEYGIVFSYSSSNNSIDDNLFSDNSDISIYLSGDCTTNTIANNTILHSHVGIYLSNSQYNILRNNTIQDNQLGIRLFY